MLLLGVYASCVTVIGAKQENKRLSMMISYMLRDSKSPSSEVQYFGGIEYPPILSRGRGLGMSQSGGGLPR